MLRLAFTVMVASLILSASGAGGLFVNEPCSTQAPADEHGGTCPPICVTCGCCGQAVEPVAVVVPEAPALPILCTTQILPGLPPAAPRDILHVPKPQVS